MSNDSPRRPRFSVGHPIKHGTLNMEPTVPLDGPVTTGPLIHVAHPLQRGTIRLEPVSSAVTVNLRVPLAAGEGARMFESLHSLIAKVNEVEAIFGRTGMWVDSERSGIQGQEITLVLSPNDPTDALDTCKRIANILFHASPGVTVKVFAADQPDTPVYELAV